MNTGWSWHLEQLEFAEATIELCDGLPSDVERAGTAFGGGTYCPWRATITSIEGWSGSARRDTRLPGTGRGASVAS